jgi:hypothetical protein
VSVWFCILVLPLAAEQLPSEHAIYADVIAELDLDGDGLLDAKELAVVGNEGGLPGMDLDGSGRVDADELAAWTRLTPIAPVTRSAAAAARALATAVPGPAPAPQGPPVWLAVTLGLAGLAAGVLFRRRGTRRRGTRRRRARRR